MSCSCRSPAPKSTRRRRKPNAPQRRSRRSTALTSLPRSLTEIEKVKREDLEPIAKTSLNEASLIFNAVDADVDDAFRVLEHAWWQRLLPLPSSVAREDVRREIALPIEPFQSIPM